MYWPCIELISIVLNVYMQSTLIIRPFLSIRQRMQRCSRHEFDRIRMQNITGCGFEMRVLENAFKPRPGWIANNSGRFFIVVIQGIHLSKCRINNGWRKQVFYNA